MSRTPVAAGATTLYHGGTIRTLAPNGRAGDALLVRDGRVVASGDVATLGASANDAERVDLRGATLMPGLVDTHPHLVHFGILAHPLVDLSDARSHADIVARIAAKARTTPAGEWIVCTPVGEAHYFIRRSWRDLAERALPDRQVLDRATADHPVMIQAWAPVIPNVCALNSAALARLGLGRDTPAQVDHVWVEKDAAGEPTGILRGSVTNYYNGDGFMSRLLRQVPLLRPEMAADGIARAMEFYNRLGVTTAYEGHVMDGALIAVLRHVKETDGVTVRFLAAPEAERYAMPWDVDESGRASAMTREEFEARLEEAATLADRGDDWLRIDGVTFSRGGPCWPGFLLMREPYRGPYGDLTRGVSFVPKEWAALAMRFCAERGVRLNVVVAGTGEHDEYLDQLEAVDARHRIRDRHWILQHVFFLEEEQARRYGRLGFDATASMSFVWGKGDMFVERVGERPLADLMPLRRMLDAGITVACGSDWGPKNVFEHIALAETHAFAGSGRRNDGRAQRVNRVEALAMWTRDAARVLRWEGIGTLAPGNHADLIVVDRDPLTCPNQALAATRVLRTVVAGRPVWDDGSL
jgi:predicted amidohydrolase YtcJ